MSEGQLPHALRALRFGVGTGYGQNKHQRQRRREDREDREDREGREGREGRKDKEDRKYRLMSVRAVRRLLREIEAHGVSEVARAPGGFLYTYLKKGPSMLDETVPLGSITWRQKRAGFIARHLAQYAKNPTVRRRLALVAWAFDPPRSQA